MIKGKKFYKNGLNFECTECGNCCSNPGGYVELSEAEAEEMAFHLNLTRADFDFQFVDWTDKGQKPALKSAQNGDCIFLKNGICKVYLVRPLQCRTFPFWPENLKTASRWKLVGKECPGIGQGKHYDAETIERILKMIKKRDREER